MSDFLKFTAATVLGIFVFLCLSGLLGLMGLVGMLASSQSSAPVPDKSVLVLNLSGTLDEQGKDNVLGALTGDGMSSVGLNDITGAIRIAKDNEKIKGIYIEAGDLRAGYASLQEIRNALADFRKSGKWVAAYGDSYTQPMYYVASVANYIWVNPKGMVDWHGLASQTVFLKDLYAKFGIKYQVVKVGKFKSYTETYTEEKMSDANRLQVSQFINHIWDNITASVASSRKISKDSLNAYADRLVTFEPTENLKRYKLVDDFLYADQVKKKVKGMLHLDDDATVNQVSVTDMLNSADGNGDGEIAVYYASGAIVQDKAMSFMGEQDQIVASTVCKDLEELMNDDDVKAVVIRVNSGGGDAYASEQLWHQMAELKKKKPVVVSMGDYAASGAYYMSCGANWIVAQPNTLTGSIGIFAVFPDASGLITQKLGVKFDEVKTNRNSSFGNMMARPLNAEETSFLQGYVNRGYELFRKRVADGRHQSVQTIENIAQGRVWAGPDALKIHLVDQLGGLDKAIDKAAKLAKVQNYDIAEYPAPPGWQEQLFGLGDSANSLDERLRMVLGCIYEPFMQIRHFDKQTMLQARMPFVLNVN